MDYKPIENNLEDKIQFFDKTQDLILMEGFKDHATYLMNSDGSNIRKISDKSPVCWVPNSDYVILRDQNGKHIHNYLTSEEVKTNLNHNFEVFFSPNSHKTIVSELRFWQPGNHDTFYILHTPNKQTTILRSNENYSLETGWLYGKYIVFSSDDKRIGYTRRIRFSKNSDSTIPTCAVYSLQNYQEIFCKKNYQSNNPNRFLDWVNNEEFVGFQVNRQNERRSIMLKNINSMQKEEELNFSPDLPLLSFNNLPILSPNKNFFTYINPEDDSLYLNKFNSNDKNRVGPMLHHQGSGTMIEWSPDSKKIIYCCKQGPPHATGRYSCTHSEIWKTDLNGNCEMLVDSYIDPKWQPPTKTNTNYQITL